VVLSKAPKSGFITSKLRVIRWLKITERIEYKLLSLTYKALTTKLIISVSAFKVNRGVLSLLAFFGLKIFPALNY